MSPSFPGHNIAEVSKEIKEWIQSLSKNCY